uniref:Uncharacterized protein n=1 Tax=Rhizophora mucronata TaxID=61149 RepID=A0A2P2NUI5_RHIMU
MPSTLTVFNKRIHAIIFFNKPPKDINTICQTCMYFKKRLEITSADPK